MMKTLLIYSLLLFTAVCAQNVEALYNDYANTIARAQTIAFQLQQTDSLSQELAAEINALRAAPANRKNKRQLYKLLPQAEALAEQQQNYQDELTLLSARIELTRRTLTQTYQAKIDSLAAREKGRSKEIDLYKQRLAELEVSRLNPPIQAAEAVAIDADDTPQIIQAKSDLYRDRADKYREKAEELQERRQQVLQTIKLRRRVSEMVSDVQLLDSRDEIDVAQLQGSGEKTLESDAENFPGYRNDYGWENSNIANTSAVRQANNLLNYDFRAPTANFEEYMQNLQTEEHKLLTQADSLYQIADEFSTIHQQMTDQLK